MYRRTAAKIISCGLFSALINDRLLGLENHRDEEFKCEDFGKDFLWGVSTSSYQTEGAYNLDGKGLSIWDSFSHKKGNIINDQTGDMACDFYHKYPNDINIVRELNFNTFRFSLSWPRILPSGKTIVNHKGIEFYHRVIDACLGKGITPWITLYHWDLPQELENQGGWRNREIVNWFSEYVFLCAKTYGDKVKNWMVLNEPVAFTTLGYLLGIHAPGRYGFNNFIPAVHHVALCQGIGGRILKENVNDARVGTTYSISIVDAFNQNEDDFSAVRRYDALLNRLFIEPSLGLGYPISDLPFLSRIEKHILTDDYSLMKFDFDFVGIQNYYRIVVKSNPIIPYVHGLIVSPHKRNVDQITEMGWEVYPEGIYRAIKYFEKYSVNDIYITENGVAFKDVLMQGRIHDTERTKFFKNYLAQILRAKKEGINVKGFFVWSLLDNFEWTMGFNPRFGLVYVDFKSQDRYVKNSGLWFRNFLNKGN